MFSLHRVRWAPCPPLVLQARLKVTGPSSPSDTITLWHGLPQVPLTLFQGDGVSLLCDCTILAAPQCLSSFSRFSLQTSLQLYPGNVVPSGIFPMVRISPSFPYSAILDLPVFSDFQNFFY